MEEEYELSEPAPTAPKAAAPGASAGKAPAVKGALTEEIRRKKREVEEAAAKRSHSRTLVTFTLRGLASGVGSMALCWAMQATGFNLLIFWSLFSCPVIYAILVICPLKQGGDLDIDLPTLIWPGLASIVGWCMAGLMLYLADTDGMVLTAPLIGGLFLSIYLLLHNGDVVGAVVYLAAGWLTAAAAMFGLEAILNLFNDAGVDLAPRLGGSFFLNTWVIWAIIIPWQTVTGAACGWISTRM